MEILVMLIMFMIVSFGGVVGGLFFEKKYEEVLPLTHFVIIVLMFFAGLTNLLYPGVWFICLCIIIGYIICFICIIKDVHGSIDKIKKNVFTKCFWIFLISYFLIWICNIGKEVHHFDEFSCWGTRVKDMCRLDMLYTSELARSLAQSYPPATALIQYLYEKIQYIIVGEKRFVAWYLFIAYQVFMVSFLVSLFGQLEVKTKWWNYILRVIFVLALPMMFYTYAYDTIMVDPILGVMLGYCFVLLLNKKGNIFELVVFVFGQIILSLTKDVTMFFCLMMWLYWIADDVVDGYYKNRNVIGKKIIYNLTGIIFFISCRLAWNQHLKNVQLLAKDSGGTISNYSKYIGVGTFIDAVTGRVRDQAQTGFLNCCRAFFSSEYINVRNINVGMSYFAFIIIFIIISVYLNQYYKKGYAKKRQFYLMIGAYVILIGYLGIIMLTYMFLMAEWEAITLNCYDRYVSMVFVMIAYVLVAECVKLRGDKKNNLSIYISLTLCLLIPGETLIQFLDRQNVYNSWAETSYIEDINKIEEIISSDVSQNRKDIKNESELTLGWVNTDKLPLTYHKIVRYGFNTNWSIKDIGEELLIEKEEKYKLRQYSYILIYKSTNKLQQLIDAEVESTGNEDYNLYRVQGDKLIKII